MPSSLPTQSLKSKKQLFKLDKTAIFAYNQEKGVVMTQQQMQKLLNVPERTLRDWKKGNREKLYQLLESLD